MDKLHPNSAGYAPLPPRSPFALSLSRLKLLSVSLVIFLVVLSTRAHAQLFFFPANQVQTPFTRPSAATAVGGGSGALWQSDAVPRIAIIGAGAGGSSAAFFLSHFRQLQAEGLASDVTVFDKLHYVGGRSTVIYPWNEDPEAVLDDDESDDPVELGASIFVDANKNLCKAARVFGLDLVKHHGEDGGMAVFDGRDFVFTESAGSGWGYWDLAKMLWRYGRAPLRVRSLVAKTVASFQALYSPAFATYGPFDSLKNFAAATNLTAAAAVTASDYFASNAVDHLFVDELIAAGTQVNYGTPAHLIHGLGALVSLAAENAHAVKGGNRKIFENFVGRSESKLRLGKGGQVTEIVKLDATNGTRAKWVVHSVGGGGTFDAVILAAPFHQTGIKVVNSAVASRIPPQTYVPLHVTFIITNASHPSPAYFSFPASTKVPTAVFGTFDTPSSPKPAFNSLNYLRALSPAVGAKFGQGTWHVIKMFSADPLAPELPDEIFGVGNVGKVWSKLWLAYPLLEPILLEEELAPVRPDEGFYYVNAMERLISTMETETVSAFNVVNLLLQDFYGYSSPNSWAEWDS